MKLSWKSQCSSWPNGNISCFKPHPQGCKRSDSIENTLPHLGQHIARSRLRTNWMYNLFNMQTTCGLQEFSECWRWARKMKHGRHGIKEWLSLTVTLIIVMILLFSIKSVVSWILWCNGISSWLFWYYVFYFGRPVLLCIPRCFAFSCFQPLWLLSPPWCVWPASCFPSCI